MSEGAFRWVIALGVSLCWLTTIVQIERIDIAVEDTMNRVQETTAAVQTTVLKPVRELNGVVSGLRAAISTLARGNRASVDHATQDEEMFI
jgi:hypothetical protein